MKTQELKSALILLLTAAIWGFAFVAQRVGMDYIGPFTFNGIRFFLGCLSLLPVLFYYHKKSNEEENKEKEIKYAIKSGISLGCVLFIAVSLQQIGLIYTSAGKAGFITSLYIVLVPIFGLFLKQRIHNTTWIGVFISAIGLYFLSINESLSIELGDFLVLIGSFFWAIHILLVDKYVKNINPVLLSFIQFATCSVLSMIVAIIFEDINITAISKVTVPLLYGGIMSSGIAYTLQAVGQKHAKPSHAAIAMSMESVFASIGGILILQEKLPLRGYIGCALILAGMLVAQSENFRKGKSAELQMSEN